MARQFDLEQTSPGAAHLTTRSDGTAALHRRRRTTELSGVVVGLLGLVLALLAAVLIKYFPASVAPSKAAVLYVDAPISLLTSLLSAVCLYAAASRWYPLLSGIQVAVGIVSMLAAIFTLPESVRPATACLLVVPVLTAGARLGLFAALLTWLTTMTGYTGLSVASGAMSQPGGTAQLVVAVVLGGAVGLLVASAIGGQTQAVDRQLTGMEAAHDAARHQAIHDGLTGLANRSALEQMSEQLTGPGALLVIDLNSFKAVNDTFGHAAGDSVLQTVAARLRAAVRAEDPVVRTGGDEFLVLLPGADEAAAEAVAAQLRTSLAEPIPTAQGMMRVGASIGSAFATADASWNLDAMTAEADARMYQAKSAHHSALKLTA